MNRPLRWTKEPGARIQGSRPLDALKVQAPCIVRRPGGGFRLFYTGIGPAKPFPDCQGYLLSAVSDDGLSFVAEPGIRVAPDPQVPDRSLRVLAPSIAAMEGGRWRMYFESRGTADRPTAILSAVSSDQFHWTVEDGVRVASEGGVGGPRFTSLSEGGGRLYFCRSEFGEGGPGRGPRLSQHVASAVTSDGLQFEIEPGVRLPDRRGTLDSAGITAAEVIPPSWAGDEWTMFYSAWQDAPADDARCHPSHDPDAAANGRSAGFAAASIASDMSGYRSRIFVARSADGIAWSPGDCIVEGAGYGQAGIDAVHAEDMSLIRLDEGRWRMYYAACDRYGRWRIASAVCDGSESPTADHGTLSRNAS